MSGVRKNLKRRRSSNSDNYTAEISPGGFDRLSDLQDDLLINILSLLPLHDAACTSVLSRHFRGLWKQLPALSFSTRDIAIGHNMNKPIPSPSAIFLPIVSAINNHDPSFPLQRLYLRRSLILNDDIDQRTFTEVDGIILSLLAKACSLGLRHLTLDCSTNRIIPLLPAIFNSSNLQSLSFPSNLYNIIPNILQIPLNLPPLKTLSLSLDHGNCSEHNELFAKLPSLENLHLQVNCYGSFSLSSQSIRHLNLKVYTKHGVKLDLPALESLRLECTSPSMSVPLFEAKLPLLKKCVISLGNLEEGDVNTVVGQLRCLSHAEESHLVLTVCLEIQNIENEKLEREQTLAAFWEHLPPVDPVLIRNRMICLRNEIRSLENRKKALLEEQQSLIVEAALRGDRRN